MPSRATPYVCILSLTLVTCSKQSAEPGAAGSASAQGSAQGSAALAEAKPKLPPPDVSKELFLAEPPQFTIEAVARGLWISVNGNDFHQSCRVSLGTAMVRVGKIRDAAKAAPDAVTCETKDEYAICRFAPPDADQANPDSRGAWIFVKDEDYKEPVLAAVVIGDFDWAKVAPKLPAKTPCPKPSADPQ